MSRARMNRADQGFATYEMILLIVALTVFLAGVVLVVNEGVRAFRPGGTSSRTLEEEAGRVLDDLEAVVREAQVVSPPRGTSNGSTQDMRLVFAADLDGTGGDFRLSEGGSLATVEGLQQVEIYRSTPRKLEVSVLEGDSETDVVTISSTLDSLSKGAFNYQLLASDGREIDSTGEYPPGREVSSIKVEIRLRVGGKSQKYSRVIKLREPAPLARIKQP